jgi:DNA-binding MarR family transcriptional regulator
MLAMATNTNRTAALTPFGRLAEAGLHQIVGYQLAQATIATSQVFFAKVGDPFELRPVEFTILTLIDENPGVTARQLAGALAVTPPNITMWMERLERRGLVERERSATDGRAQSIRTTRKGSSLAKQAVALLIDGERDALNALSSAERAMLVELLHKVGSCRRAG